MTKHEHLNSDPDVESSQINLYFSDFFNVPEQVVEDYGAFNISLVVDLPLFVDPFLLFHSRKPAYQALHEEIIRYLKFLRNRSSEGSLTPGLLKAWYHFKEVRQTWLGFSQNSNEGRGLGRDFARALDESLGAIFTDFGQERITRGSHLEKICLIKPGVGRDTISDFTTNLIRGYLAEYTQTFAVQHIAPELRRTCPVQKSRFNYQTESWQTEIYDLPFDGKDFVLLTPRDILTQDETWINKEDFYLDFHDIPFAIGDQELREQVDNYFRSVLPENSNRNERNAAVSKTALRFPQLFDYFIKRKEDTGDLAAKSSKEKVEISRVVYVEGVRALIGRLRLETGFYDTPTTTCADTRRASNFLKMLSRTKVATRFSMCMENRFEGKPISKFYFAWFGTVPDTT